MPVSTGGEESTLFHRLVVFARGLVIAMIDPEVVLLEGRDDNNVPHSCRESIHRSSSAATDSRQKRIIDEERRRGWYRGGPARDSAINWR